MDSIPNELIDHILQYAFKVNNITNGLLTCKLWYGVLRSRNDYSISSKYAKLANLDSTTRIIRMNIEQFKEYLSKCPDIYDVRMSFEITDRISMFIINASMNNIRFTLFMRMRRDYIEFTMYISGTHKGTYLLFDTNMTDSRNRYSKYTNQSSSEFMEKIIKLVLGCPNKKFLMLE